METTPKTSQRKKPYHSMANGRKDRILGSIGVQLSQALGGDLKDVVHRRERVSPDLDSVG